MAKTTDPLLEAIMKGVRSRRGTDRAILGSELSKYQTGVQLPYLMMERLLGLNVLPCSSLIELAGPPKSCKSAFLQYLFSVYANQGFISALIETEGKLSYTLLESFLLEKIDTLFLLRGPLIQEVWQNEMLEVLKMYRAEYAKLIKTKKGRESVVPFLIGLDSLGGSPSQDSIQKVDSEGSAGRSFPVEALKNKVFFEQLPTRLLDLPITVIYTNHEKSEEIATGFNAYGPKVRRSKGGITPGFFCGIRIFFDQATKEKEIRKGIHQQVLKLEVAKNSFNATGVRMELPMEWTITVNPETNEASQVTTFRWDEALAYYLAPSVSGFDYDRTSVSKFLTVTRQSNTKFSCKELGLKEVPPGEIGRAIESNPEIKAKLRPYLGIKTWRSWDGTPISTEIDPTVDLPDLDEAVEAEATEEFVIGED